MERRAKIVATIGPATEDEHMIERLILAGMNIARLNFSHGTQEGHAQVYERIRRVSERLGRPVTILQDLQGPKIRTGSLKNGQVELIPNQPLTITTRDVVGDENLVPVDFPQLLESVQPGARILMDDGNLELVVIDVHGEEVETRVVQGGILKSNKGVNLPGAKLDIPGFTDKDEADLAFGLSLGVDAVAISFVRSVRDLRRIRRACSRLDPEKITIPVIAKLERPEALENLDEIVLEADGVMVARGDLGVEMSPEAVPIAQKCIIQSANRHSKLVITATQMLDSMINNPRPTRAEASDVANAILDGTDAVMLSGETAAGKYPIQAVEIMDAIIREAEAHIGEWGHWHGPDQESFSDDTYYMTRAASEMAHDRNVAAIAVFTQSGRSALMMSKNRPGVPILAFTPSMETYRRLGLYWGVIPHLVKKAKDIESMVEVVEENLIKYTSVQPGQQVVLTCGFPVDMIRPTNMALLHTVGEW